MIIKQTRIAAGGAGNAANYIQGIGENEQVHLLHGDADSLAYYADTAAEVHGHKYCLRHVIFSPDEDMRDATPLLNAFLDEFDIGDRPYAMAVHYKERSDGNRVPHYHLLVAESDSRGKVLDNKNNYKRNEKMARRLEVELGHDVQKGRHNLYVVEQMKQDPKYYDVVDDVINENITEGPLPRQAFTKSQQGKAKRLGINLAQLHQSLKEIEREVAGSRRDNMSNIIKSINAAGCELLPGTKAGVLLVADRRTKEAIGSLDRLSGITRKEMQTLRNAIEQVQGNTNGRTATQDNYSEGYKGRHSDNNKPAGLNDARSRGGSDHRPERSNTGGTPGYPKTDGSGGNIRSGNADGTVGVHKLNLTRRAIKHRLSTAAKRNQPICNHIHSSIPASSDSSGGGAMLNTDLNLPTSAQAAALQQFFQQWSADQKRNLGL